MPYTYHFVLDEVLIGWFQSKPFGFNSSYIWLTYFVFGLKLDKNKLNK